MLFWVGFIFKGTVYMLHSICCFPDFFELHSKADEGRQADAHTPMSEDIRTDVGPVRRWHPIELIMLISACIHHSQGKFQPKGIASKTTTMVHF